MKDPYKYQRDMFVHFFQRMDDNENIDSDLKQIISFISIRMTALEDLVMDMIKEKKG